MLIVPTRDLQSQYQDERLVLPQYERLPAATAAPDPLPLRLLDKFLFFVTDSARGVSYLAGLQQLSNGAATAFGAPSGPLWVDQFCQPEALLLTQGTCDAYHRAPVCEAQASSMGCL